MGLLEEMALESRIDRQEIEIERLLDWQRRAVRVLEAAPRCLERDALLKEAQDG